MLSPLTQAIQDAQALAPDGAERAEWGRALLRVVNQVLLEALPPSPAAQTPMDGAPRPHDTAGAAITAAAVGEFVFLTSYSADGDAFEVELDALNALRLRADLDGAIYKINRPGRD